MQKNLGQMLVKIILHSMVRFTHRSFAGCREKETLPATQFSATKTTNRIKWIYKVNALYYYIRQ